MKQVLWTKGAERNFLLGGGEQRDGWSGACLFQTKMNSFKGGGSRKKSLLGESYTKRMPGAEQNAKREWSNFGIKVRGGAGGAPAAAPGTGAPSAEAGEGGGQGSGSFPPSLFTMH